ncbi:hypothetical protein KM043_010871 [Ampulex compressa]|nr:hypothetical protein KM043_010871 [Ampulex compressa]
MSGCRCGIGFYQITNAFASHGAEIWAATYPIFRLNKVSSHPSEFLGSSALKNVALCLVNQGDSSYGEGGRPMAKAKCRSYGSMIGRFLGEPPKDICSRLTVIEDEGSRDDFAEGFCAAKQAIMRRSMSGLLSKNGD